jgi:hypothetical protein
VSNILQILRDERQSHVSAFLCFFDHLSGAKREEMKGEEEKAS